MKILIASDSYKESLSALQVAEAIECGFKEVFPQAHYHLLPVADGGEGTVDAVIAATHGTYMTVDVMAPLGNTIQAQYGITGDGKTAIIEMAVASGLMLVPLTERNPLKTTSFGTGELIKDALDRGIRHIILGIGGSATNDGGVGMLQALGVRFLNVDGKVIDRGGAALKHLHTIDVATIHPNVSECVFEIACDVDNPLLGDKGATAVFGPQKGATPDTIQLLEEALEHYAHKIHETFQMDVRSLKGGGAAGGMGVAAHIFLRGQLRSGIEIVLDLLKIADLIQDVDLVITGEGRIDGQSIYGKTPIGVAKVAKFYHKPVIGIAGSLGMGAEQTHDYGLDAIFSTVNQPCTLEEAYKNSHDNVRSTARNIAAILHMSGF